MVSVEVSLAVSAAPFLVPGKVVCVVESAAKVKADYLVVS